MKKKKRYNIVLSDKHREMLEILAKKENRSMSNLIETLVEKFYEIGANSKHF